MDNIVRYMWAILQGEMQGMSGMVVVVNMLQVSLFFSKAIFGV